MYIFLSLKKCSVTFGDKAFLFGTGVLNKTSCCIVRFLDESEEIIDVQAKDLGSRVQRKIRFSGTKTPVVVGQCSYFNHLEETVSFLTELNMITQYIW